MTELVDVSDFDSDDENQWGFKSLLGSHYAAYTFIRRGRRKRRRSLRARASRYSLRRLLRLGVIPLRFCEFFVGKKNKTRILYTFGITVIILVSKTMGSEFES